MEYHVECHSRLKAIEARLDKLEASVKAAPETAPIPKTVEECFAHPKWGHKWCVIRFGVSRFRVLDRCKEIDFMPVADQYDTELAACLAALGIEEKPNAK